MVLYLMNYSNNLKKNNMKQTAVEWLTEKLRNEFGFAFSNNIFEQAKEMEKEQIINAGNSCALKQHLHSNIIDLMSDKELNQYLLEPPYTFGEQYYNEKFKKDYDNK